ncbi:BppU family phage baseplate upper protein [Bacillus sp. JNUCC-24]|uniref:BppU family phage baseplate upper protein n=1 Tax=Bacillus sp. JNUCC-24 TaxID=2842458 RepID=UPI001C0B9592|nr:BppU family phage baseplate upper protein [Bacillus sp. JNUCC-24]QWS49394.1 BppU family phage baseplate upper protein [Bacillus sp. JNUCC-24]
MIRKNGPLDFDVNAYTSSSVSTSINFWTQDRQTARLTFKLTKEGVPLPLAAVTGKLVLVMADGSRFIRDVTIVDRVNGHAEYVLSDKEIKHYGIVQAELNLYYTNDQSMSVHQFSFNISKSLIDQGIVPITEYYVDEFEALRAKINELYEESIQTIDDLRAKFKDLDEIETKQGAQDKVDAALAAAKKYTDAHAETPAGAKDKVAAALEEAKEYVDPHLENKKIHVTESEKSNWNKGQLYRLTPNDGKVARVPNGTDIFTLPTGPYMGAQLLNAPVDNDTSFYYVNVLETVYEQNEVVYKCIIATRSFDNITWIGTFHAQGFKGWDRVLSEKDLSSTWNQVTLVAGTTSKHFAGNPLQFSIRQNELRIRGSFEGIPATDTVIARFAQKPTGETAFLGATVGSYGSARLTLAKDGSLKFNGLNANDNTKVTRIEINESIPLW